jgi:hypothetical protein
VNSSFLSLSSNPILSIVQQFLSFFLVSFLSLKILNLYCLICTYWPELLTKWDHILVSSLVWFFFWGCLVKASNWACLTYSTAVPSSVQAYRWQIAAGRGGSKFEKGCKQCFLASWIRIPKKWRKHWFLLCVTSLWLFICEEWWKCTFKKE